ncbi:HD domain-containing protein [Candidatus Micrarchaeota archaeon]|nr:HD domain-containing protein [Candidatus Micrarchaeota archaeon]
MPYKARPVPQRLKRIAVRPSAVVFNEQKPTQVPGVLSEEVFKQLGVYPIHVQREAEESMSAFMQRVHQAMAQSIGLNERDERVSHGFGNPLIIHGEFSDADQRAIRDGLQRYRIQPYALHARRRPQIKQLATAVIEENTIPPLRQPDVSALAHAMEREASPGRAAHALAWYMHNAYVEGRRPTARELHDPHLKMRPPQPGEGPLRGSSTLAMISRPDPYQVGSQKDDPGVDYLKYVSLIDGTGRNVRALPVMRLDEHGTYRALRLHLGMEGNQHPDGTPAPHLTVNFPNQIQRQRFIDEAMGYTPCTEGDIHLGHFSPELRDEYEDDIALPEAPHLASFHFYKDTPLPAVAFDEMHKIARQARLNRPVLDLWRNMEIRFGRHAGLISRMKDLEDHDEYTRGHSERVAALSELIARIMNADHVERHGVELFSRRRIDAFKMAALLHDVGKLSIPGELLRKKDLLAYEEFEKIKEHPVHSDNELKLHRPSETVRNGARHHHERWDGKGYPDGLAGTDIPLVARIIAMADVMDAFLTERDYIRRMKKVKGVPYGKRQFSWERVRGLMHEFTQGGHFDPDVFAAAMKIQDEHLMEVYKGYAGPTTGLGLILSKRREPKFERAP